MDDGVLINIAENFHEIHDYINFMLVSKVICHAIYPIFISTKFIVMILLHQRISPCSLNNYKIKAVKRGHSNDYLVITDNELINKHCQFAHPILYETYGLFVSRINYDIIEIDYEQVVNFLAENEYLINSAKVVIKEKKHLWPLSIDKSYSMTFNNIERVQGENYKKNMEELKKKYHRYVKLCIRDGDYYHMCTIYLLPNKCIFCGEERNDISYCSNWTTDGHGWRNKYIKAL